MGKRTGFALMEVLVVIAVIALLNSAFLDSSVRKGGLRQLWTLKWYSKFNTANSWTRAGGAGYQNWPEWMRNFREY